MQIEAGIQAAIRRVRQGVLVTIAPDGIPRPVPFCFIVSSHPDGTLVIHSPIDEKPKREADPMRIARVRDIERRPDVAILVAHWDEDWSRLGWIRLIGRARVLGASDPALAVERTTAVEALRDKYPQYREQRLESRPIIRIAVARVVTWGNLDDL